MSNERSEELYRSIFFCLIICSRSIMIFRGLAFVFKFNLFPLFKGRQTALSNSKSLKGTKNMTDF